MRFEVKTVSLIILSIAAVYQRIFIHGPIGLEFLSFKWKKYRRRFDGSFLGTICRFSASLTTSIHGLTEYLKIEENLHVGVECHDLFVSHRQVTNPLPPGTIDLGARTLGNILRKGGLQWNDSILRFIQSIILMNIAQQMRWWKYPF